MCRHSIFFISTYIFKRASTGNYWLVCVRRERMNLTCPQPLDNWSQTSTNAVGKKKNILNNILQEN